MSDTDGPKLPEIQSIPVAAIEIPEGRRQVVPELIDHLAESFQAVGHRVPIEVHVTDDSRIELVAGLHRLLAHKKLGWNFIAAVITTLDALERELFEIDENLVRANLTELERSQALARQREIYDTKLRQEKLAKTASIAERKSSDGEDEVKFRSAFDRETADKLGVDSTSIYRQRRRAERIPKDVQESIADTAIANSQKELDALGVMDHDRQREAVERVLSGQNKTVREAKSFIFGGEDTPVEKRRRDSRRRRLHEIWLDCDREDRDWFIGEHIDGGGTAKKKSDN